MSGSIRIDRGWLDEALADLEAIDSVNPTLIPGAAGERAIGAHVAGVMRAIGMEVTVLEETSGRPRVVGVLRGVGGGPSLMLNAHVDTVGVQGMRDPHRPRREAGRLYGRGAYDMKGSLAACLAAVRAVAQGGPKLAGDLYLSAVADEEVASLGARETLRRFRPDAAIVTEPTELELCIAHKGFVWIEVEMAGRAAHGSRFDLGRDANLAMGRFLSALGELEAELRARPAHPLLGPPSLHVGTLNGGTGLSTYADLSVAGIERRTVPGETAGSVRAEIEAVLAGCGAARDGLTARARVTLERPPFQVDREAAVTRAAFGAARAVLGAAPSVVGKPFWMDAALFSAAGIETVVLGPAGAGAHELEEWVDLDSVEKVARILASAAVDFCGQPRAGG